MKTYMTPLRYSGNDGLPLNWNGFTEGKPYEVIGKEGSNMLVLNDNGHERSIGVDQAPSAHITTGPDKYGCYNIAGYFAITRR